MATRPRYLQSITSVLGYGRAPFVQSKHSGGRRESENENSAMDCCKPRGTCVRVSPCGSGWQWRRKRWRRRSGRQRRGRTRWSGRQRGRHVRRSHEQQGRQQHQRLQFSRPRCRPCPRGGSIGHAGRPCRRANEQESSCGSNRSCAFTLACAGEHEAPPQPARRNQPFDLMKHRGRPQAPSVFHLASRQQFPFFACPGGQKPLPGPPWGPPCGTTTTPGESGTYSAQPPSRATPAVRTQKIFFMGFLEEGLAPFLHRVVIVRN